MKKLYFWMSIGLMQALTQTSCVEEKIVNENTKPDLTSELADYTVNAIISQPVLARANWQEGKLVWGADDKFALWNRNTGLNHQFSIIAEGEQFNETAKFSGEAVVRNGDKLIAIYPYVETSVFNELGSFSLPDTTVQATGTPDLSSKFYMLASTDVTENAIPNLTFSPITSLLNFHLKNTSGNEIKLLYLTLEGSDAVFPATLGINDNGEIASLSNLRSKVTIDMQEQPLADGIVFNAALNVLPTCWGDNSLMMKNTELSLIAKVWTGEKEVDVKLFDKVPVSEMAEEVGLDLSETAYQFIAGMNYDMALDLDYHFKVPEEGYIIDEKNQIIHVYNVTGLKAWRNKLVASNPQSDVILERDYTGEEMDLSGEVWEPIEFFSGTFDGNQVKLKNVTIKELGLVNKNNGTIRNLILDSPRFASEVTKPAGFFASVNNGVIENCLVNDINVTVTKPVDFGALVGQNSQPGTISNSVVNGGTITLRLNGNDSGSANLGVLVGQNYGGTGIVINSHVENVMIDHPSNSYGASNVGGLVGYNNIGKIKACYAVSTLAINCSAQSGGLVGTNANGTVLASYAVATINGTGTNNTGGLIGFNNGGTTIVTSCYVIPTTTMNHAKSGALIGNNVGNVNSSYVVSTNAAIASGTTAVGYEPKCATNADLEKHLLEMNLAIESVEETLDWNFKINDNTETKDKQPLVLQSGMPVPGFGGEDFEEGGNI